MEKPGWDFCYEKCRKPGGTSPEMQALVTEKYPFDKKPKTNVAVTWLKPELVCEVKFAEWTRGGQMRQPIFIARRDDKPAADIVHEKTLAGSPAKKGKGMKLKAGNRNITFSNPGKLYWPKEKISKGTLASYYLEMAPHIMPYLKGRPQSLHRHPDGITKPGFFQKDFDLKNVPDWLSTAGIYSESTDKEINYLLCNNTATLLYMVNLGCIEINPWLSRHPRIEVPDYLVIDLDPEKIAFSAVVETALAVKDTLDELKLAGFCKTSGATGLHIYIPLNQRYDFDTTRIAAEFIAGKVHERIPKITSLERSPAKRQKKVYVDYLQNRRGQTLAAPYSVRPRPGATVSAPLDWSEVDKDLDPVQFTMHTIGRRIRERGDPWKFLWSSKNSLARFLK